MGGDQIRTPTYNLNIYLKLKGCQSTYIIHPTPTHQPISPGTHTHTFCKSDFSYLFFVGLIHFIHRNFHPPPSKSTNLPKPRHSMSCMPYMPTLTLPKPPQCRQIWQSHRLWEILLNATDAAANSSSPQRAWAQSPAARSSPCAPHRRRRRPHCPASLRHPRRSSQQRGTSVPAATARSFSLRLRGPAI